MTHAGRPTGPVRSDQFRPVPVLIWKKPNRSHLCPTYFRFLFRSIYKKNYSNEMNTLFIPHFYTLNTLIVISCAFLKFFSVLKVGFEKKVLITYSLIEIETFYHLIYLSIFLHLSLKQ